MEPFLFLLSPVAMGYVPTFLVQVVIIAVLLSLKQKTLATRFFIGWQICLMLLVASLLLSTIVYAPIGGYINWIGGNLFALLAITLAIQFAYRFPYLIYRREAILVLVFSLAAWVGMIGLISYESTALPCRIGYGFESFYYNVFCTDAEPFYSFSNNLFNLLHPLGFLWVLVIWLRQSVHCSCTVTNHPPPRGAWRSLAWWRRVAALLWKPQGSDASAARALALAFSVAIFAAILVPLEEQQLIPVGSFASAFLVSEAIFILTYLDYSFTPTTFKVKLVGIPLVTTMMMAGLGAPMMLKWTQEHYHETRHAEVHAIAQLVARGITDEMPSAVRYVATRPTSDGLFSSSYTMRYTSDPALDATVLAQQDAHMQSLIAQTGATDPISPRTWHHLTHVYPWIGQHITGTPTRSQIQEIIPPEGHHAYRGHFDSSAHHFIRYTFSVAPGTLGEVGYSYPAYRNILHTRALPLFWMLTGAIVLFLVVVPFFVQSSLVRPLNALLQGVRRVEEANLYGTVPVRAADEIGLLTGAFNRMVNSLRGSREALIQEIAMRQEKEHELMALTTTLEERVSERTQELQLAREEAEHARQKAEEANQAKSIFLANMSHELRTPLNAILGFTQIMTRSTTLPQEHHEYVDIISRSGDHLLTLINNVLDLSKIEAGRMTLNETTFDLHSLLSDLGDMFRLRAREKGLSFQVEYPPNLPHHIRTDAVKLRQILINLLSNAMKFTHEGGVIVQVGSQDVDSDHATIHFGVEDSGTGMAPDELEQLFEAFGQTSSGRQAHEGTGLGLAISRKFVQRMGGDMSVQSEVGRGSIFAFTITVALDKAGDKMPTEAPPQVIGLVPGQPTYRILITDDRTDNRTLLIKLLAPLGFDLREARNGQEALAVWEMWHPHLIWMDMRMPVMDGYEATRRIKDTPQGQQTVVVALTASVFDEEQAHVMAAGGDDFMRKPFRENDIYHAMATHLGVRYCYAEDETVATDDGTDSTNGAPLTTEAFARLPLECVAALQHAALLGDIGMLHQVIDQIRAYDTALADRVYHLVESFQFEQIVEVIPVTGEVCGEAP